MNVLESSRQPGGAGVAAGQTVLLSLAVCEAIALDAIGDPVQRSGAVLQARRLRARSEEALELSTRAYTSAREQLGLAADVVVLAAELVAAAEHAAAVVRRAVAED